MIDGQGDNVEFSSDRATTEQLLYQFSNTNLEDIDPLNMGVKLGHKI